MKKIWLVLAVTTVFGISQANAQKPAVVTGDETGWYKIGTISASFSKETESIIVIGKDEFSSIRLRVKDAPISIERVQIFFEGGKVQEAEVKQPLQAGEETREIDLYAENLEIDKVVFTYKTNANDKGEKAEVELFGYKSHRDGSVTSEEAKTTEDVRNGTDDVKNEMETSADSVIENVNEAASKADAETTDEKLDEKTGPDGQTIYVDDNKNYYWVDEQGSKHYISVLDLKDKEE